MPQPSVFIVEDEAIVANDIEETLQILGYSVAGKAKDGVVALQKIAESQPDLVLMDIHIAGAIDGIETAEKVHSRHNIPVIFLTAHADSPILERAKKAEPYGYIIKPFDERGLQSTIEMALYKFRADERVKDSETLVRSILNLHAGPVFLLDRDTSVLYINDAFSSQGTGPAMKEPPAHLEDLVSSGRISPAVRDAVREHFYDSGPFTFEQESGNRWLSFTLTPLRDPAGQVTRLAVESSDITEIKKRELDLTSLTKQLAGEKQSLQLFMAMLDSMDDFVVATDMMGNVIYVNRTFRERIGYSLEDVTGKHISTIKDPADLFVMDKNAFFVDKKRVWSGNVTLVSKFGIRIRTLVKSTPVALEKHNVSRVFVFRERLECQPDLHKA